jgi:hypothetical protein
LKRRSVGALEGRVLFVDVRPLHALRQQNRTELEQSLKSEPRNEKAAPQREQLDLLVTLCSRLDPEFKPLARRGDRIPRAAASTRSSDSTISRAFSPTRRRCEPRNSTAAALREHDGPRDVRALARRARPSRRRSSPAPRRIRAPGGPWEMKDMSVSGFRLLAPTSRRSEVTLSMLVAVHRAARDSWALGIVAGCAAFRPTTPRSGCS